MIRALAITLLTTLTLCWTTAYADQCKPLHDLSDDQWDALYLAAETGAPHGLEHTLMAVVFKESTAGKFKINPESGDYGLAHNNIRTAMTRTNKHGYWAKRQLMTELVTNDQLSLDLAVEELLYWQGRTQSWVGMVSAYNQGNDYDVLSTHTLKMRELTRMMMDCVDTTMFNEETPMDEDAVGDLVQSFNDNHQLMLEPKVVGSYTGKSYNEGTSVARSRKTATLWASLTARLSRMWT